MANLSNFVVSYRLLKHVGMKWKDFDAYKLGIIDGDGSKLRSPETPEEKDAYDSYWKIIINLKRILQKFVGKSSLVQKAVSLLLLKEGYEEETVEVFFENLNFPHLSISESFDDIDFSDLDLNEETKEELNKLL